MTEQETIKAVTRELRGFEVGDKVKILVGAHTGKIGIVTIVGSDNWIYVDTSGQPPVSWYRPHELEHA